MNPELKQSFEEAGKDRFEIEAVFAHPGICITEDDSSDVQRINHFIPSLKNKTISDKEIPETIERFHTLRRQAIEQYQQLNSNLTGATRNHLTTVFDTYMLFLMEDQDFSNKAIKYLNEGYPLGVAIEDAAKDTAATLASSEMLKIRAYSKDMKDIGKRMIRNMLNIPHPDLSQIPHLSTLVSEHITTADLLGLEGKHTKGAILHDGTPKDHVGGWFKGERIPAAYIYNSEDWERAVQARRYILDGINGKVICNPSPEECERYREYGRKIMQRSRDLHHLRGQETKTACGEEIRILATVATEWDIDHAIEAGCDGIGLLRSELLFIAGEMPDEEAQIEAYKSSALHAKDLPVFVFRTFDFEGDKMKNFSLTNSEKEKHLKIQMRAALQGFASFQNKLVIEIPNIVSIDDPAKYRQMLADTYEELKAKGKPVPASMPEFGIMNETNISNQHMDSIAKHLDWVSQGSNDLTANFVHADRTKPEDLKKLNPLRNEILLLFQYAIRKQNKYNLNGSICGNLAGNEKMVPLFLAMGLRDFSVHHGEILEIRNAIRKTTIKDAEKLLQDILAIEGNGMEDTCKKRWNHLNAFCLERNIGLESALGDDFTNTHTPDNKERREP